MISKETALTTLAEFLFLLRYDLSQTYLSKDDAAANYALKSELGTGQVVLSTDTSTVEGAVWLSFD